AHDLAFQVDQRAPGISRVDGRIGLDEVVVTALADEPSLGADDTRGDRMLEAEWVADGHHPFADAQLIGVAEGYSAEIGDVVDLDDGDIRLRVTAHDLRLVLLFILELDDDFVGVLDDVVVGEDVAVAIDDEAGAQAALLERALRQRTKEAFKR